MKNAIVHNNGPIVAVGGADLGPDDLNISLLQAPRFVAADRGADHLLAADIRPAAVIGDLDSLSVTSAKAFADVLMPVEEQDTTDFEKVVQRVAAPLIIAVGFLGGRLDHTMAVLNVLARYPDKRVLLLGEDDVCFLARQGQMSLAPPLGCRVAILPIGAAIVSTTGLAWNLNDANLAPDGAISVANEAVEKQVSITVTGPVIVCLARLGFDAAKDAVHEG